MKRIEGARSGLVARVALRLARRKTRQIAGAKPEQMIEPLEAYAHLPLLTLGYSALEEATGRLHRGDQRVKGVAELNAAALTQSEYCIDIGYQIAARAGITEAKLLALPRYRDSELFAKLEKLVLD